MSARFLLAGADGQLGRALVELLGERLAWAGDCGELDIRDAEAVARVVAEARPTVVVNAAAYNKVDAAEQDVAEALAVNALGPRNLARAALSVGALAVHVSTDYVFDGCAGRAYVESDVPRPLSAYGASKLSGELLVAATGGEHLIVRTSGVFAIGSSLAKGGSFPERILARARKGERLRVVTDQVLSPTYAPDLAAAILALVERGARGLVHVANAGACSWHAFARATVEEAGLAVPVEEILTADLSLPARRPAFSPLESERLEALGVPRLRPWREALRELVRP